MSDSYSRQYRLAMESKDFLTVKTAVSFIAAVVAFIVSFLPLPQIAISVISIILIAIVYGVCFHELTDGLVSLFGKMPSNDSLCAVALIFSLARSVWLIFAESEFPGMVVWIVFLAIGVSMLMKLLYILQIVKNIEFIEENNTYSVEAADADLKKRLISKVFMVNPVISFPDVVSCSYEQDPAEKNNRIFVPVFIVCTITVSVIAFILGGADSFFLMLASVGVCGASFTGEAAFILPYIVAQQRLRKLGSVLLGAESIDRLKDIDTLVVEDSDLFTDEYSGIVNIRFFKKSYVSKSLEYAAVLLDEIKSPIAPSVFDILECERESLPHVSFVKNIQNHGVYAKVNGEDVLLGNRNLLLSHNISPLSQEQEAAYMTMNRNLFYLAVRGELAAVLLVQYSANPALKQIAERIGQDFNLIVETRDCNINEYTVQTRYDLKKAHILVPEGEERKLLKKTREDLLRKKSNPVMITTKNAIGILTSVERAKKLSGIIGATVFLKTFSIILGAVLTAVAVFAVSQVVPVMWIFIYALIWLIPVIYLALQ